MLCHDAKYGVHLGKPGADIGESTRGRSRGTRAQVQNHILGAPSCVSERAAWPVLTSRADRSPQSKFELELKNDAKYPNLSKKQRLFSRLNTHTRIAAPFSQFPHFSIVQYNDKDQSLSVVKEDLSTESFGTVFDKIISEMYMLGPHDKDTYEDEMMTLRKNLHAIIDSI